MSYPSEKDASTRANAIDYLTLLIRQVLPQDSSVGVYCETSRGLEYRATWDLRLDRNSRLSTSHTLNIVINHEALDAYGSARSRDRQVANERLRRLLLRNFETRKRQSNQAREEWEIDRELLFGADEVVRRR